MAVLQLTDSSAFNKTVRLISTTAIVLLGMLCSSVFAEEKYGWSLNWTGTTSASGSEDLDCPAFLINGACQPVQRSMSLTGESSGSYIIDHYGDIVSGGSEGSSDWLRTLDSVSLCYPAPEQPGQIVSYSQWSEASNSISGPLPGEDGVLIFDRSTTTELDEVRFSVLGPNLCSGYDVFRSTGFWQNGCGAYDSTVVTADYENQPCGGIGIWGSLGGASGSGLATDARNVSFSGTTTAESSIEVNWHTMQFVPWMTTVDMTATKLFLPVIHGIELTQAIQVYQQLGNFALSLRERGGPPIPIVAHKPLAIRVVLDKAPVQVQGRVEVSWNGVSLGSRGITVGSTCDPPDMLSVNRAPSSRDNASGTCRAADFFLDSPNEGANTLGVKLYSRNSPLGNKLLEEYEFEFTTRVSDSVIVGAVNVCATRSHDGTWNCVPRPVRDLRDGITLMKKIYPTDTVEVEPTGHQVRLEIVNDDDGDEADCYDGRGNKIFDGHYNASGYLVVDDYRPRVGPIRQCEKEIWWDVAALRINRLFGLTEATLERFGIQWYFYGLVTPNALTYPYYGSAHDIPGRGALGITTGNVPGLQNYTSRDVRDTVVHEIGHLFGLEHVPPNADTSGCDKWNILFGPPELYLFSDSVGSSGIVVKQEVGYDVERRKVIAPFVRHDMMSYCDGAPTWASPLTYHQLLNVLSEPAAAFAVRAFDANPVPLSTVHGDYWLVSGFVGEDFAFIDSIVTFDTEGFIGIGEGTHRLEVRNDRGDVLFTRNFTPAATRPRQTGHIKKRYGLPPSFSELIPVDASAAKILIVDITGVTIAEQLISGISPVVTIISPAGGEQLTGVQPVSWMASDSDSDPRSVVYWVQYSPDGGATWMTLGQDLQESSLNVDFDELPGSANSAIIRVMATDSVNTGSASSHPFTVGKKSPTVDILSPEDGDIVNIGDVVLLQAFGYDLDDGVLQSASHIWTSDLEGDLGAGKELSTSELTAGRHIIEVSVTDTDGNTASSEIRLTVADTADEDSDGVINPDDRCPGTAIGEVVNANGCSQSQLDDDSDGVPNGEDNCPGQSNSEQSDMDQDGVGDICDNCVKIINRDQRDSDADGIGDECEIEQISDLSTRSKSGKVSLVWSPITDSESYNVYRSEVGGGPYNLLAAGHVTSFATYLDESVASGTTYFYVVTAIIDGVESDLSNEASATPSSGRGR